MTIKEVYTKILAALKSRVGHNVMVFSVFLVISALLWWVTILNEDSQADVRMPVTVTHVPDSVTIVSEIPKSISVSLKAKGTSLLQLGWGRVPVFNIDFRQYRVGNAIRLSDPDLKAIARNALGGGEVSVVVPDPLKLAFTTSSPVVLPVHADYIATPGPQATIVGKPVLSADSVKVFSAGRLHSGIEAVTTEPLRLSGLTQITTQRVKIIPPANSRVIPDSVDVTINVEPLILKTRKVPVETVNVPHGQKLITFPSQVEVMYMIPVSAYKSTDPVIRVQADYNTIRHTGSRMINLKVTEASDNLRNVHLANDSAEYIIEHL